ncbi:hypothetical protein pdam_00025134, partial [Pocillopora damicornis]
FRVNFGLQKLATFSKSYAVLEQPFWSNRLVETDFLKSLSQITEDYLDKTACLQAITDVNISNTDLIMVATKICHTIPVLKDPKPAPFLYYHDFLAVFLIARLLRNTVQNIVRLHNDYFFLVQEVFFLMKRRLQNIKGYQRRKVPSRNSSDRQEEVYLMEKDWKSSMLFCLERQKARNKTLQP